MAQTSVELAQEGNLAGSLEAVVFTEDAVQAALGNQSTTEPYSFGVRNTGSLQQKPK